MTRDYSTWTTAQEQFLYENAHKGPEWIARAMAKRFGVNRSPHSIEAKASRIGVSLVRYEICHSCWTPVAPEKVNAEGICDQCRRRQQAEFAREQRYRVENSMRIHGEGDQSAIREYDRERKRLQRTREQARKKDVKKDVNAKKGGEA